MKKFFIIVMAVALCFAFTAPAMAKVTVGGLITTDFYYMDQSDERAQACVNTVPATPCGNNGVSETNIHMPNTGNRLFVKYKNDDNTLSGYMQLRGGGDNGAGPGTIDFKYAYLDYKINDSVHFRAGRQSQAFAVYTPGAASMGFHDGFTLLVNYGNIQTTDGDSVKLYVKFNDQVRLELQLEDPAFDGNEAPAGSAAGAGATGAQFAPTVAEENTIPRIDIALPIAVANWKIEPAFSMLTQEYRNVAAGFDDSVDMWGFSLGARAGFGPFTISSEFIYGQNLGDDTYTGAGGTPGFTAPAATSRLVDTTGNGIANSVADSDFVGGWIQGAFKFNPQATLQVAVGMETVENAGSGLAAIAGNDDIDTTRWGLGVSMPITVTKGFKIQPAVIYHDRDDSAHDGVVRAGNPTVDLI